MYISAIKAEEKSFMLSWYSSCLYVATSFPTLLQGEYGAVYEAKLRKGSNVIDVVAKCKLFSIIFVNYWGDSWMVSFSSEVICYTIALVRGYMRAIFCMPAS